MEAGAGVTRALPLLSSVERVLCLGAHPDDIEIGCGATLRTIIESSNAEIRWLVLAATPKRAEEVTVSAAEYLTAPNALTVHMFRDGFLPFDTPSAVKEAVLDHRSGFVPDLVFSPRRDDAHQDHGFVAELASQVYRSQTIMEYDIPKYDGDLGPANTYVPVTAAAANRKVAGLLRSYPSQHSKPWFDKAVFLGLLRLRGVEAAADSGLAEAFVVRKLVIG